MDDLQDMLRNNPLEVALSENKELHKQLKDINDTSTKVLNELQLECEKNEQLRTQLAKANERVRELEKELKESEDDLDAAEQQLSSYENALEEVQAVFVDSDACPLFEPFNPRNLSAWLNKFAIEKKIEALSYMTSSASDYLFNHDKLDIRANHLDMLLKNFCNYHINQLRKEQD